MNSLKNTLKNTLKTTRQLQKLNQKPVNTYTTLSKNLFQTPRVSISNIPQYSFFNSKNEAETKQEETENKEETQEQEKEQEQKEEQQEEKQTEKKVEELPEDFNKLIAIGSEEALVKAQNLFKNLENKLESQEKDSKHSMSKVKLVEEANNKLQDKINELKRTLKIELDDFDLARVRLNKEKEEQKIFAISKFAKEMLETTDNLERALEATKDNKNFDNLLEGAEMTYSILMKSLIKYGVKQVNPLKEKFDPNLHDALMQVDDPSQEAGTVAVVIQSGFTIGERCLRPAKVGIVRARD